MLQKISSEIKEILSNFSEDDKIIFNNKLIDINKDNFKEITPLDSNTNNSDKTITFVDGGQAEIISTGNFCLSFIRVFAQTFSNNKKINSHKNEFYLFTKSKWINDDLFYESKIFPVKENINGLLIDGKLIDEEDLFVSSNDQTIKTGLERAPISKISNMARRFAELSLANQIESDFIILDGTLDKTFKNEEKYLSKLPENVCALAKTSSLFTTSGNSPVILLNKIGLSSCWSYLINEKSFFVKLHEKAKHVFRFESNGAIDNNKVLSLLVQNSNDALFLGYPYGLIFADKFARISNEEKNSLKTSFLLRAENKEIVSYLNSTNAHEILDGFD